jgi:hypothetical protein
MDVAQTIIQLFLYFVMSFANDIVSFKFELLSRLYIKTKPVSNILYDIPLHIHCAVVRLFSVIINSVLRVSHVNILPLGVIPVQVAEGTSVSIKVLIILIGEILPAASFEYHSTIQVSSPFVGHTVDWTIV